MSPLRKEQSRAFDALSLSVMKEHTNACAHTHTHHITHVLLVSLDKYTGYWYKLFGRRGLEHYTLRVLIRKNMPSQGNQTPCQETALHKRRQHVNTNVWSVQTGTCWEDHKLAQMLQLRVHRWQEMGPEWRQFEDRLWRDAHGPSKPWALFYTVEKPVHGVQV